MSTDALRAIQRGQAWLDGVAAWPDLKPLPEDLPPVPELDPILLPEALRPWIEDVAERIQCPLEYPAVGAMVVLAAVVGRQVAIRPRQLDDWTVVPNLWGAIVGRPGLLKTPALAEVLRPLQRLEEKARDAHAAALKQYEAERTIERAAAKERAKAVEKAVRAGDTQQARELALAGAYEAPEEPVRRRYATSDTTVEKLGELLRDNPRGVLVFRDELVGWLKSLDREGHESARAFYLEAWNGTGRFSYDRIGRGTIDIEATCISVLGAIQPGPLGAYLRHALDGGSGDDGLLQRFQLVVWPDAPATFRDVDRAADREAQQRAWHVFERLDNLDPAAIGAEREDSVPLPYLRLDPPAYEEFTEWRLGLEQRLRAGEEHPAFEAHLAKYRSLLPSLALLIHLVDCPEGGPVSEAPVVAAIAWAGFLEAHARRLYAGALDPALHAARELDRHIRAGDLGREFTARDVYRRQWRLLDRRGTEEALAYLQDLNRLRPRAVDATQRGGRQRVVWEAHPELVP